MKYKTAELTGELLDAAVALAEGRLVTEADEHPAQPGYYLKTRKEWGEHIVRWFAREGENADGPETDEEGGWEPLSAWGSPSTDWGDGGPLIDRYDIQLGGYGATRSAEIRDDSKLWVHQWGSTSLEAAMRALVAWKLGEEVELP